MLTKNRRWSLNWHCDMLLDDVSITSFERWSIFPIFWSISKVSAPQRWLCYIVSISNLTIKWNCDGSPASNCCPPCWVPSLVFHSHGPETLLPLWMEPSWKKETWDGHSQPLRDHFLLELSHQLSRWEPLLKVSSYRPLFVGDSQWDNSNIYDQGAGGSQGFRHAHPITDQEELFGSALVPLCRSFQDQSSLIVIW